MPYVYQTVLATNTGFISLLQCLSDGELLFCASEFPSVLFVILVHPVLMQDNCLERRKNLTKCIFTQVSFLILSLLMCF